MNYQQQELLLWASQHVPRDILQRLDFTDGVCFAYILDRLNGDFPQLHEPLRYEDKLYNLQLVRSYLLYYKMPVTFDIGKLITNDPYAIMEVLYQLRDFNNYLLKPRCTQSQPQMSSTYQQQSQTVPFHYLPAQQEPTPFIERQDENPRQIRPQVDPLQIISNLPPGTSRLSLYADLCFLKREACNQTPINVNEPLSQSRSQQENIDQCLKVSKSTHSQMNGHHQVEQIVVEETIMMNNNIGNVMKNLIKEGLGQQLAQFHADLIHSTECQDEDLLEYRRNLLGLIEYQRQNTVVQDSIIQQGGYQMNQSQQQSIQANHSQQYKQENHKGSLRQHQNQNY